MTEEGNQLIDIHFHKRHVPLPISLAVMFLAIGAAVLITYNYRENITSYSVFLSSSEATAEELIYGSWPALEDPQFFSSVRSRFIDAQADFMEINLTAMKIKIYKQGALEKEMTILAKGKEGWLSETPAGLYRIESKNAKALSSFAGVYMPWSINFHGNYFIHGEPYYPSGRRLNPRSFTGGCIQLTDKDAKEIYAAIPIGTPVLVFEQDLADDDFRHEFQTPEIRAESFLAADLKSNFVFLEKLSRKAVPIGSLTKLVTAMTASEHINFARDITVSRSMLVETVKPRLKSGRQVSVINLLFPLLMESSNEAATVLANYLGVSQFVNLMNEKAQAIGMETSSFTDPTGRASANVASTEDLFKLAKYIYNNRSFLLRIASGKFRSEAYEAPLWNDLENFNGFRESSEYLGGVTAGFDDPKGILGIFEIDFGAIRRPVAIVALESEDPISDVENILNWLKLNY